MVHRPGVGEREVLLQLGDRDRDDRLVDERHRDGEDHRQEHEALVGGALNPARTIVMAAAAFHV